jgi:hypothetical protein
MRASGAVTRCLGRCYAVASIKYTRPSAAWTPARTGEEAPISMPGPSEIGLVCYQVAKANTQDVIDERIHLPGSQISCHCTIAVCVPSDARSQDQNVTNTIFHPYLIRNRARIHHRSLSSMGVQCIRHLRLPLVHILRHTFKRRRTVNESICSVCIGSGHHSGFACPTSALSHKPVATVTNQHWPIYVVSCGGNRMCYGTFCGNIYCRIGYLLK